MTGGSKPSFIAELRRRNVFAIGSMMLSAGDVDQGRYLLDQIVSWSERATAVYGPGLLSTMALAGLGDKEGALRQFRVFTDSHSFPEIWPIRIRNFPAFELFRDEPEFIKFIERLETNAAEQRVILSELLASD